MDASVVPAAGSDVLDVLGDVPRERVLRPGDAGYDDARKLFNGAIDKRPAAIVRCAGTTDVVACVNAARASGLPLAARAGGHAPAGPALADGGIVCDLTAMRGVDIDPVARRARVQGGATWGDLDAAAGEHNLAVPGGRITTTGVAGLTLGGGQGWLSCKHGLTCDNLLDAEVVTADGRVVRAADHPDLLWALRGAGANFGVVTEFVFELHPLPPLFPGGMLLFPAARAVEAMRCWRDVNEEAPDELCVAFAVLTAPPAEFVPPELQGRLACGIIFAWFGDADGAAPWLERVRALAPAVDVVQPMPYVALQQILDESAPYGLRMYMSAEDLVEFSDAAIDAFCAAALKPHPFPLSQVVVFPLGNAAARVAPDATAFGRREGRYLVHPIAAAWTDPEGDAIGRDWTHTINAAVRPFATGAAYINLIADEGAERTRSAYGVNYDRLVELKRIWDPGNLFRAYANIVP